jgi:hypothetical protein
MQTLKLGYYNYFQPFYFFPEAPRLIAEHGGHAVSARSNTDIVGSNPTRGMDVFVCLFCDCVAQCVGSSLKTGCSQQNESYRLCIRLRK